MHFSNFFLLFFSFFFGYIVFSWVMIYTKYTTGSHTSLRLTFNRRTALIAHKLFHLKLVFFLCVASLVFRIIFSYSVPLSLLTVFIEHEGECIMNRKCLNSILTINFQQYQKRKKKKKRLSAHDKIVSKISNFVSIVHTFVFFLFVCLFFLWRKNSSVELNNKWRQNPFATVLLSNILSEIGISG